MEVNIKKRSPRAPGVTLNEALERAFQIYEAERLHPAPTDVVAQALGYKNANNGAALALIASLRYLGLLSRPKDGFLAVTKELEAYKFAPDETMKRSLLIGFLRRPQLYTELLERYSSGLPSDANLKFELIQRGFAPNTAETVLTVFRKSVEFAGYFDGASNSTSEDILIEGDGEILNPQVESVERQKVEASATENIFGQQVQAPSESVNIDKIPVRLSGGRRAWLHIPMPFYEADKSRLKAQIDLLMTEEDENSIES